MLRATSKFFYHLPAEHLINEIFLELKMDEIALDDLTDWNDGFPMACSVCHCFVGPECNTLEQTGKPLKTCECGRKHYNVKRPGVLVYGECKMSHCEKCREWAEICGPMLRLQGLLGRRRSNRRWQEEEEASVLYTLWSLGPPGLAFRPSQIRLHQDMGLLPKPNENGAATTACEIPLGSTHRKNHDRSCHNVQGCKRINEGHGRKIGWAECRRFLARY
jgi:hypothetical protein